MPHDNNIRVQVLADEQYEHPVFGTRNVFRFVHEDGKGKYHYSPEYACLNMGRMYYHTETPQENVTRDEVNEYRKRIRKELAAVRV